MKPFEIARVFDAPREWVWQAWTEAERLKQWFAPKGFTTPHCTLDLRPGGLYHYCLRGADGKDVWGKWVIREVAKPKKLVFVVSFSDPQGGTTVHPMNPTWPREMLSTVTFEAQGAKTKVSVRWIPLETSTDLERKTFEDGRPGMNTGWSGTLDHLTAHLSK